MDAALDDFGAAIDAQPKFRQAWEQRGTIHHHRGEWQRALEDYTRAILLGPEERVDLYYNRGLVLIEMEEYEQAILNFDHGIAVDRHFLPLHLARAGALHLAGRDDEARLVCEALMAIGFESAPLYHHLHSLFAEMGDEASAAKALEIAEAIEADAGGEGEEGAVTGASTAGAPAQIVALEEFHAAASPEAMQQLVATYPFMADPSFISAAEQSIKQRQAQTQSGSKRQRTADAARLLWLRTYARL